MRKFLSFLPVGFLAGVLVVLSGCSKKTLADAEKAYATKGFAKAAEIYGDVYDGLDKAQKGEVAFKTGESYRMFNQYAKAEKWYRKAIKDKYGPEAVFQLAEMLKCQEKYPDAIIEYNNVLKETPNDVYAQKGKEGAELALKWKQEEKCLLFVVENVKKVNTSASEYGPTLLKKEGLVFTSDREEGKYKGTFEWTGKPYSDLWLAKMTTKRGVSTMDKPIVLEGPNTKYNDGAGATDGKASVMYYTICGGVGEVGGKNVDGKLNTCQIFMVTKKGKAEEWTEPQMLPFCDTAYNYGQVSLSSDGKKMFFSSDMPGGQGGHDIWSVSISGRSKTWSDPLNLGPVVNTDRDEMFPYIHSDGTLYFSSNGHVGMGGLDIFTTTGTGNEWTTPVNLKHPLNSGGDDFAPDIADDKATGYFSSNRPTGGKGNDDIYEFRSIPLKFNLTGRVTDCRTGQPIREAQVFMSNDKTADKLQFVTDKDGFYKTPLGLETSYELFADKHDAFYIESQKFYQSTKGFKCSEDLVQNFQLCQLDIYGMFDVQGILYDLDSARIRPDAAKILDDSVVSILKRFPNVVIELGSHTDCRASAEYNRALAQRRADSAVNYIIRQGIDSARLIAKGYGEDSLKIQKCKCDLRDYKNICTEAEHQLNRRTTVKVLRTDYVSAAELKRREEEEKKKKEQQPAQQQNQQNNQRGGGGAKKSAEERKAEQEEKRKQKEEERQRKADERKRLQEEKKKQREEEMKRKKEERENNKKKK